MALAYECDICGNLFKPEMDHLNEVQLSYKYIENGSHYRTNTMTTCPECMHYFVEYINKHYADKNKQIKEVKN